MNNKRRCLACLPTMKSVAIKNASRGRLVSSTIRDESVRGDPGTRGPASSPQRHVVRSIGRPSGRKTHRRVRLAHASGERNPLRGVAGPSDIGGVQTYSFLFLSRGPTRIFSRPVLSRPFLFPLASVYNVWSRDVIRKLTRFRVLNPIDV